MIYAQLYWNSTGWNGENYTGPIKPVEMLGSDGVIMLDARRSIGSLHYDTKQKIAHHLKADHIKGYRLFRGKSFTSSKPITELVAIDGTVVKEEAIELKRTQLSNQVRPILMKHFGYEPCCEVRYGSDGTISFCSRRRYTEHSHNAGI